MIGDRSLSKEILKGFDPLNKFGANIKLKNNKYLPLLIDKSSKLNPIKYHEKKVQRSASTVIFAGLRTDGTTIIKAKNQEITQS